MYEPGADNNPLVIAMDQVSKFNSLFGGWFSKWLPYGGVKPLDVDLVARATIAATLNETIRGVVDADKIAQLAS